MRRTKLIVLFTGLSLAAGGMSVGLTLNGCSLAATRPVQEMSNADAAIRAAKDLHADSLVPEIYRAAADTYFKAKREYRLKNFDVAKKLALKTAKLAEKAEFEAYRLGGATPEIAAKATAPEGATPDSEEALKGAASNGPTDMSPAPAPSPVPTSSADEKGIDYNAYVQMQEEEKKRQEEEQKRQEQQKNATPPSTAPTPRPGGPTGPAGPKNIPGMSNMGTLPSTHDFGLLPTTNIPTTSGLAPLTSNQINAPLLNSGPTTSGTSPSSTDSNALQTGLSPAGSSAPSTSGTAPNAAPFNPVQSATVGDKATYPAPPPPQNLDTSRWILEDDNPKGNPQTSDFQEMKQPGSEIQHVDSGLPETTEMPMREIQPQGKALNEE